MRPALSFLAIGLTTATALADEAANHRFDPRGAHQPEGFPEQAPRILVVAEKPVTLHFSGLPSDWQPVVHIHRVTAARRIALASAETQHTDDGWRITWTPPQSRGRTHYEIRLDGEPARVVRIEARDRAWLDATREALANAAWEAHGLTTEERNALATHGIKIRVSKAAPASLEMRPRQGDAARRRIVWDEEYPALLVWRPGPAAGDLEARAPRWWISPAALATDDGLIRFLDLFSEPPLNP